MTATNHALTGAFIGLAVGNPWIAVPAAFASHFVLDALPHYNPAGNSDIEIIKSKKFFYIQIVAGASLCTLIVLVLFLAHPTHWLLASVCAFLATSPDLLSFPRFLHIKRTGKDIRERSWFWRFHHIIQWFQRPIGWVVELAWLVAILVLLIPFLR
ncbi:MAG TPA: hypothetical protein VLG13_02795 [Patescibacteria group bacterium]|nr:hypothetical protein [Patescibacteria group bacterium]